MNAYCLTRAVGSTAENTRPRKNREAGAPGHSWAQKAARLPCKLAAVRSKSLFAFCSLRVVTQPVTLSCVAKSNSWRELNPNVGR